MFIIYLHIELFQNIRELGGNKDITLRGRISGFDGLEVAYWPLVPKFAGSNPTEAVGFFRAKKS